MHVSQTRSHREIQRQIDELQDQRSGLYRQTEEIKQVYLHLYVYANVRVCTYVLVYACVYMYR